MIKLQDIGVGVFFFSFLNRDIFIFFFLILLVIRPHYTSQIHKTWFSENNPIKNNLQYSHVSFPQTTLLSEEDARSTSAGTRGMTEALAGLDSDGDGCIGVAELLRIPAVRVALLLQNPALLTPANPATPEIDGML